MDIIIYDSNFDTLKQAEAACANIFPHSTISVFNKAASAKEEALSSTLSIAIINIDDEAGRGKALAEKVVALNKKSNLILVSNSAGYSAKAMRLYPSGYLVKPITKEDFEGELKNLRHPVTI